MGLQIKVLESENDVASSLVSFILSVASQIISSGRKFSIGLSGGSVIKLFSDTIIHFESNWSNWNVLFCDERHVSYDSPDSTYGSYNEHLFNKVPIPKEQILNINYKIPVEESAIDYQDRLRKLLHHNSDTFPEIDLLLLGVGPDGHICSLFPGHSLLKESTKWVAPIKDSPKPPPSRITLTFPVINNARNVVFVACGEGKADILKKVIEDRSPDLPASLVAPVNGNILWLLDKKAASQLNSTDLEQNRVEL